MIGYDNSHVAGLTSVDLTTVAQDAVTLATAALDLAVARAEAAPDRAPSREVVVAPRLVERHSAAQPGPG